MYTTKITAFRLQRPGQPRRFCAIALPLLPGGRQGRAECQGSQRLLEMKIPFRAACLCPQSHTRCGGRRESCLTLVWCLFLLDAAAPALQRRCLLNSFSAPKHLGTQGKDVGSSPWSLHSEIRAELRQGLSDSGLAIAAAGWTWRKSCCLGRFSQCSRVTKG